MNQSYSDSIWHRINQKIKPLQALGQLEALAHQLALIQSQDSDTAVSHISIQSPTVVVFAGDHGIAEEGVSIAPSAVTQQMVQNFLSGGAAINCFCRANQIQLKVVDAGMLAPVQDESGTVIEQRLGQGTNNFAQQAAMTIEQVQQGIELGKQQVSDIIADGSNLVMFGEMGIGNTSSAAAIFAALSEHSAEECVGRGTGITDEQWQKKSRLVAKAVARCDGLTVMETLAEVGGFEIVQMTGGFLAAAEYKTAVIVDGFIATTAAYVATLINPECRDYMIFAHQSHESGHALLLAKLEGKPLLDLSLRLGEGTGAALAVPLIRATAEFYNSMASFEEAGVTVG